MSEETRKMLEYLMREFEKTAELALAESEKNGTERTVVLRLHGEAFGMIKAVMRIHRILNGEK